MTFARVFDIGAACVFAFFIVRGALRGMTMEIVSMLGFVVGVACSWTFAQPLAALALEYFPSVDSTLAELLCAAALFIAVSLIFTAIGRLLQALVRAADLTMMDHFMGVFLGALRTFFLFIFIYGVVSVFSPLLPGAWMQESVAMKGAAVVWPPVLKFLTANGWLDVSHLTPPDEDAEPGAPTPRSAPVDG